MHLTRPKQHEIEGFFYLRWLSLFTVLLSHFWTDFNDLIIMKLNERNDCLRKKAELTCKMWSNSKSFSIFGKIYYEK